MDTQKKSQHSCTPVLLYSCTPELRLPLLCQIVPVDSDELDQVVERVAGKKTRTQRQRAGFDNFGSRVAERLALPVKIFDLQAEMVPGIGPDRLPVRDTMQFNSGHAGIKPDPTQRFDYFRGRLLAESENPSIKIAHACFLPGRKSNGDVLEPWQQRFILIHTGQHSFQLVVTEFAAEGYRRTIRPEASLFPSVAARHSLVSCPRMANTSY